MFRAIEGEFKDVRDGILAHRDPDPNVRIALHNRADPERVAEVALEVLALLVPLYEVLARHQRFLLAELREMVEQLPSHRQTNLQR